MSQVDLNKQTVIVPGSETPGSTGCYRYAGHPEIVESISPDVKTMYDLFARGLQLSKDQPCLGHRPIVNKQTGKRANFFEWQSYSEVAERISSFGSGLLHFLNQQGFTKSRQFPIGIWAVNRPEWLITDLACAAYSLYIVALYDTLGPETVEYVINHAGIETIVCSGDHIADLLKLNAKIPNLKNIISMDILEGETLAAVSGWAQDKGITIIDFATIESLGKQHPRPLSLPQPNELACIMYTSGTTGLPKGAMLTHRNFVSAVSASVERLGALSSDSAISYLPLAHIFGRVNDMLALTAGGQLGFFSGSTDNLMEDIQILRPTTFATVPRLLNRIYGKIYQATMEAPGVKGAMARRAIATKLANLEQGLGNTHALWDRLIFNKVKQALGGRVRVIVSGSAPLGKDVMQFLRVVLCCDIREGYGATETSAATTVHSAGEYKAGHIGAPFSCNEIKLADVPEMNYLSTDQPPRGEVCVRGPSVFLGYYKDEEKTREAIDEDGWFHTGDIGLIDERGCLVIVDRKKNIFKLAQGEYIAPEKIENVYAKDPIVGQIYLHGDSLQSSLVAIIVPDPESLATLVQNKFPHLKKLSYNEWCANRDINKAVLKQLTKVGQAAGLHGFELAKAIYLETDPFTIEKDLLTPTLKVKRPQARKYYEAQIAALYEELDSAPKAKL